MRITDICLSEIFDYLIRIKILTLAVSDYRIDLNSLNGGMRYDIFQTYLSSRMGSRAIVPALTCFDKK